MKQIFVTGVLPEHFAEAFAQLRPEWDLELADNGFPVVFQKADGFALSVKPDQAVLYWKDAVECYRGLSLLSQYWGSSVELHQPRAFETAGMMFDVSRNAVLKPETMRFFLRKMAMMGLNLGMMYTEDTYEIPEYPYFGYLRGRYTIQELRALDEYAGLFGIELCPCIQTMGHLNRALHWPAMAHMKDTEEVLLAEDGETEEFIRAMLRRATEPYRSNRIHIGMDEAHFLGLGNYLRKHGYTDPFRIMEKHLQNVGKIVRELGLQAMMWSDMYFRLASPTGGYYDVEQIPKDVIAKAPADIDLVYWDYYSMEEESYERMLALHQDFAARTVFACGFWTWGGPAPHYQRAVQTMLPGLRMAKKYHIPMVIATAWGDNGAECNLLASLYAMTIYAQMCYQEDYDPAECAARFRSLAGADAKAFEDLTRFNQLPGVKDWTLRPVNAAKFLLYQDPIVPLFENDLAGIDTEKAYQELEQDYARYQKENPAFEKLFGFYAQLARTLRWKCAFHTQAGTTVRGKDRKAACCCAEIAKKTAVELNVLRETWRELWYETNRMYGFEIIDLRLGGIAARMESAAKLMEAFARGEIKTIAPLEEVPLPYTRLPDGALRGSYAWGEIVSACKTDI